jgi:hypothetical protein
MFRETQSSVKDMSKANGRAPDKQMPPHAAGSKLNHLAFEAK